MDNLKRYEKIYIDYYRCKDLEKWKDSLWIFGRILQRFKGNFMPILLKLFQKSEEEAIRPNSLYEANVTLITKPSKENTHKK